MANVAALIHGEAGTYGISFPDFPGVVSGGRTIDEALGRGRQALAVHVETLITERLDLPRLRGLEDMRSDPALVKDFSDAVMVAAVPVDLPGRAMRINISMDESLVARIDQHAARLGESRSKFLARAARRRLAQDEPA